MKKTHLIFISLFSLSLLLVYSCRKSISNFIDDQPSVSSPTIEAAKIWRASHLNNTNNPLQANWNNSWTVNTNVGKVLVVPAPESSVDNVNNSVRRVFLFVLSGNQVVTGRIIEFWGNKYDVSSNLNTLISDYYHNTAPQDFSGSIFEYSVSYAPISSKLFEQGEKKISKSMLLSAKFSELKTQLSNFNSKLRVNDVGSDGVNYYMDPQMPTEGTLPAGCTVYYEVDQYYSQGSNGVMRLTDVNTIYKGTKCVPVPTGGNSQSGASSNGSSSGDDPSLNPNYGSLVGYFLTGGGGGNYLSYDIRPNVNKCIEMILNAIKFYANLQNEITNTFGLPDRDPSNLVQAIVYDVANSPNHRITIKEEPIADDRFGSVNAKTLNSSITLNPDYLNTATNLSVARTLIHEIVHNYLAWKFQDGTLDSLANTPAAQEFRLENQILYSKGSASNANVDDQHNQIAVKYVDGIAQMLYDYAVGQNIESPDNTLTLYQYCHDMAWAGLEHTDAYNDNNVLSGPKRLEIERINNNEKDPSTITSPLVHATIKINCH